jgi:hypothetical protein
MICMSAVLGDSIFGGDSLDGIGMACFLTFFGT